MRISRIAVVGITAWLAIAACDGPSYVDPYGSWADAGPRQSTMSIGSGTVIPSLSARAEAGPDKMSFRSSDLEFWMIGSATDISSVVSSKYVESVDYTLNHSLEFVTGDGVESIVFQPDLDVVQAMYRSDLNPNWQEKVAAFLAAGRTTINMMRLDVGAGRVTFRIDGSERLPVLENGQAFEGIGANSIVFVDEGFLSEPVYIPHAVEQAIISGSATAASLGISESDYLVVEALHTSSNWVDEETPIDVNGALILPMTPVDISGVDTESETLDIVVSWNMEGVLREDNGSYVLADRVGGLPFDFSVTVTRSEYVSPPPAGPADHESRLVGTGLSLDDYLLTESWTDGYKVWNTYQLRSVVGPGTTGSEFIAAVPDLWPSMPDIAEVVSILGKPPEMLLVDVPNGSHLTFVYTGGDVYFGHEGSSIIEIRFVEESSPVFTHSGVSVGSPLAEVLNAYGAPVSTVHGDTEFEDQVLYVGAEGGGYIGYNDQGVRFFFQGFGEDEMVVASMYLFSPGHYD